MTMTMTRAATALSMAAMVGLGGTAIAQESNLVFKQMLSENMVADGGWWR